MQEEKKPSSIGQSLVMISQLGITVLAPTLLLLFLGVWLDGQFKTWFAIPLMLFGLAGGCRAAWSMVKGMNHSPSTPLKEQYDLMKGWYDTEDGKDMSDDIDDPEEGEPHG